MPGGKLTKADAEAFWSCADRNGDGELTIGELRRGVAGYCKAQGKPCPDNSKIIVSLSQQWFCSKLFSLFPSSPNISISYYRDQTWFSMH